MTSTILMQCFIYYQANWELVTLWVCSIPVDGEDASEYMKHIFEVRKKAIQLEKSTQLWTPPEQFRQASRCMFKQEKRKWCALRVIFSGLVEWENMRKPSRTKRNGRRPQNICRSSLIISGHSGVHHWSVELTGFPSVRRYIPCTSESSNASWKNKIRTS